MAVDGDELSRGSMVGAYRIDQLIGRGGTGAVYRATDVALNRIYALKVVAPTLAAEKRFRERFKREMQIAASLHHPNIVGIHYAGEHESLVFFVMDYLTGTSLHELLLNRGAVDPGRGVDLLEQLGSALDAAHSRGLVHGDVNSKNILIAVTEGEERAYLTDFGLTRDLDGAPALDARGSVPATVDCLAPEQITGSRADARTDIYALGCVFHQMLTGRAPFERENAAATIFAHVHEGPPPLEGQVSDTYPGFAPVLDRALAKEPGERYMSAGDFARDAAAALRGTRDTSLPTVVGVDDAASIAAPPTVAAPSVPPGVAVTAAASPPPAIPIPPDPGPGEGPPDHKRAGLLIPGFIVAALIGGAVVTVIALTSGTPSKSSSGQPPGTPFVSSAQPVPTNQVTGNGTATVRLNGNEVAVTLDTNGLLNGSPHAMHIHAGAKGVCPPASAAHLHNGHPSISTTDGIKYYGPPEVALTSTGDTSPKSIIDFSRYPATGHISYTRTLAIPAGIASAIRAGDAVIVVHGIDYNHNGVYDNILDRSELNNALPGEATAPALCGPLTRNLSAARNGPSSASTYTVVLHRAPAGVTAPVNDVVLLCHLLASDASDPRASRGTAT